MTDDPRFTNAVLRGGTLLLGLGLPGLVLALAISPDLEAQQIDLDAAIDTPVVLAGQPRTAYLRFALKAFELAQDNRAPVNLAIVLDRSGSMQGTKLEEAKRAAIMATNHLKPDDIISVVTYDNTVHVLVPATKAQDLHVIHEKIRRIGAGGSTALFAGVSKGASEVRKFLMAERVNRVILLSDGIANVGPSSPSELAALGGSFRRETLAVTTIGLGLGYNEELMSRLAEKSDGNHFFAENAEDLARVYKIELGEVLSVVAQDVDLSAQLAPAVRPVRILGREANLDGQNLIGRLNQLYSQQTKYFLLEVNIPAGQPGDKLEVARVEVSYANMATRAKQRLSSPIVVRYTDSPEEVEAARDPRVVGSVARQIGAEQNRYAMRLRDAGKVDEARALLLANAAYLQKNADLYGNKWLEQDALRNSEDAENLEGEDWQGQRKKMESNVFEALQSLGYIE